MQKNGVEADSILSCADLLPLLSAGALNDSIIGLRHSPN